MPVDISDGPDEFDPDDGPEPCADCAKLRAELVTAFRDMAKSLSIREGGTVAETMDFIAWRLEN